MIIQLHINYYSTDVKLIILHNSNKLVSVFLEYTILGAEHTILGGR